VTDPDRITNLPSERPKAEEEVHEGALRPRSVSDFCVRCQGCGLFWVAVLSCVGIVGGPSVQGGGPSRHGLPQKPLH